MLEWIDKLAHQAGPAALIAVGLGAALEYVFPPFPGDMVTVLGGLYAVRSGSPFALVFTVVMAGSLGGAWCDYLFGRWLGGRIERASPTAWYLRVFPRDVIRDWESRFQRRGAIWLVINRFLPAIRGPIFVAAGVSRVPTWKVLLWGGVSAATWNGLLFTVGWLVGGRAHRIEELLRTYGRVAWALLVAILLIFGVRWMVGRRRRSS